MGIYKNSIASKCQILPLGTVTLTAGPDSVKVVNIEALGGVRNIVAVLANGSFAGATTVSWAGSTVTAGTGTLTTIATLTLTSAHTEAVLQIDAEDVSRAAEVAGLLPSGFKSLVLRVDAANADTVDAAVVVYPFHEYDGLTPSDVTVLT